MRNAAIARDDILQKDIGGQRYVTTRDVLREEQRHDEFCTAGRPHATSSAALAPVELDPALSDEQRQAALMILNSRDRVTGSKAARAPAKPA